MKILKIILINILVISGLNALEFGGIGNISASMGGAGVALRNSQWALYYNPALLGLDKKSRLAYSFGANVETVNFLSLASIDYQNIKDVPKRIEGVFGEKSEGKAVRGFVALGTFPSSAIKVNGIFGDILKNINFTESGTTTIGLTNTSDIKSFLTHIAKNAGATSEQLESINGADSLTEVANKFKDIVDGGGGAITSTGERAFVELKDSLTQAMGKTDGDTSLLESIVDSLTPSQVGGLAELLTKTDGEKTSIGLNELLTTLGGVSLSANGDRQVDRFIRDINSIQTTLNNNNLSVTSQNGFIFQIGGKGVDGRGAIAFGVFGSGFASASATLDPTHNQIIIDASDGNYAKVEILGNKIMLNTSSKGDFDEHSILSNNAHHKLYGTALIISELPVGYGQAFSTPIGNFSIGFVTKYIYTNGYSLERIGSAKELIENSNADVQNQSVQTFGLDFGALYNYANLNVGVVGKNLNAPTIKINDSKKIIIDPQIRAGVSYEWKFLSLALDMDLTSNNTLSHFFPSKQNQMIGGGVMIDFKYVDFRFGSMYNLRDQSDEGLILTGGLNILGFLDIAVQSSTHIIDVQNYRMPQYLSIKVGGGFSW